MERENYYFDISDDVQDDKVFVLIIYDITDNKTRLKLSSGAAEKFAAPSSLN